MIDEKIGEILSALEEKDYLKNSIIVFTSDHGDCMTDHGHSQKWTMYDHVTRVPMIVWAPDGRFGEHRKINDLVHQMDIGPTFMDLAGIEKPEPMSAHTLIPMLDPDGDDSECARDVVYAEQAKDGNFTTSRFMTMVRTRDWKLVHFLDEPWGQLFDLKNDPDENNNLWNQSAASGKQAELLATLREWRIRDTYENADLWSEVR